MARLAEKTIESLPTEFPIPEDVRRVFERKKAKRRHTLYEKFCRFARKIIGALVREYRVSERTKKDLKDSGLQLSDEEWAAGMLFSFFLPILPFLILWLVSGDLLETLYLPILGSVLGGLSGLVFQLYPSVRASTRRAQAQSLAINTVMLLSFFLYHKPDLRGATVYAADASEGKLAEDLQRGLFELDERRRFETVRHLLVSVANEWGEIDDNVRQAIFDILRSSGTKDESMRIMDIAKAPNRVLEGSEEQLTKKLGSLVMPTLAFLTFGSLAIIGAVGLSPVFSMIGVQLVDLKFFVGIAAALVVSFAAFTLYMERNRPATVQIMESWKDDPRLPPPGKLRIGTRVFPSWVILLVCFLALGWPGVLYLVGVREGVVGQIALSFSTMWLVWGVGAALGVYGYAYARNRRAARDEERRKVSDWANALNTIGSRMLDGKPAQVAMVEAAELMEGSPLASELKGASSRMNEFGMNMKEAIVHRQRYNPVIAGFLHIISRIRRDNEAAAGRACMLAAEFLRTLQRVERRFRERIDEAMSNLWLVSVVLIPVVCAMAVWVMNFMSGMKYTLAAQMSAAGVAGVPLMIGAMEAAELSLLRLVMGLTSILLSAVIARYIAVIKAPGDSVELWSLVAKSAVLSSVVFTIASLLLIWVLG